MPHKLLTLREVSEILKISEVEIQKLVEEGKIPAYKIAGSFLRFRPDQVELLKNYLDKLNDKKALRGKLSEFYDTTTLGALKRPEYKADYTLWERIKDFIYFNDFYIIVAIIIIILAVFIFYNY